MEAVLPPSQMVFYRHLPQYHHHHHCLFCRLWPDFVWKSSNVTYKFENSSEVRFIFGNVFFTTSGPPHFDLTRCWIWSQRSTANFFTTLQLSGPSTWLVSSAVGKMRNHGQPSSWSPFKPMIMMIFRLMIMLMMARMMTLTIWFSRFWRPSEETQQSHPWGFDKTWSMITFDKTIMNAWTHSTHHVIIVANVMIF